MSHLVPTIPRFRPEHRGQTLLEFALLLPMLLMLVGGIVQYGILISTSHTLTQIGRDLGRWVATQDAAQCADLGNSPSPIAERADAIALKTSLMGYGTDAWKTNFKSYGVGTLPAYPPNTQGVEVAWDIVSGTCPPDDSSTSAFVTLRLTHQAPVVLPGFGYLPGIGTCDSNGCYLAMATTAVYRMEPQAAAPSPTPTPNP